MALTDGMADEAELMGTPRGGPLFEAPRKVYPRSVSGPFRRLKWLIMAVTLAIYYVTPWLRWDRGPHAPDQAVLVDLASRRFYFFFIEIWPQEFYYVAGLLIMAGLGLFLITSVAGRVWCGYACPQTVWVDLFLVVERFFEGDRNKRMALDAAPFSWDRLRRRTAKYAVWLVIAMATGGAWIFYFADAPTLAVDLVRLEAAPIAYSTIAILTMTTFVFGGFMREQVCTYMCPWPRIQSAMLDENSLTVTYNDWRGEPRSRHRKRNLAAGESIGDCIDCNACVAVCPMGIDIRKGQQMECITCALCIDACDDVMAKIGLERGLIAYATLSDYDSNMKLARNGVGEIDPARVRESAGGPMKAGIKHFDWRALVRPRTLVYLTLWAGIGVAMLVSLSLRERMGLAVEHDRSPLFVQLTDGSIRNAYTLKISNMTPEPRAVRLSSEGLADAALLVPAHSTEADGILLTLPPDRVETVRLLVSRPPQAERSGRVDFTLRVTDTADGTVSRAAAVFESPKESRP